MCKFLVVRRVRAGVVLTALLCKLCKRPFHVLVLFALIIDNEHRIHGEQTKLVFYLTDLPIVLCTNQFRAQVLQMLGGGDGSDIYVRVYLPWP